MELFVQKLYQHAPCSLILEKANVVLSILFNVVNNIVKHCYAWLRANSGSTIMLNNIVDNIEQCGQHNIIHIPVFINIATSFSFFAMNYRQSKE